MSKQAADNSWCLALVSPPQVQTKPKRCLSPSWGQPVLISSASLLRSNVLPFNQFSPLQFLHLNLAAFDVPPHPSDFYQYTDDIQFIISFSFPCHSPSWDHRPHDPEHCPDYPHMSLLSLRYHHKRPFYTSPAHSCHDYPLYCLEIPSTSHSHSVCHDVCLNAPSTLIKMEYPAPSHLNNRLR